MSKLIGGSILVFIFTTLVIITTMNIVNRKWELEAIKRGYGRYVLKNQTETIAEFQWIDGALIPNTAGYRNLYDNQ